MNKQKKNTQIDCKNQIKLIHVEGCLSEKEINMGKLMEIRMRVAKRKNAVQGNCN